MPDANTAANPLLRRGPLNLGGFSSLRLAYFADVQAEDVNSYLTVPTFLLGKSWFTGFEANDFKGELKMEGSLSEAGAADNYSFKAIFEASCSEGEFDTWFRKTLRGRRLIAEIVNTSQIVRTISPLIATYLYTGPSNFQDNAKFEITFSLAKRPDLALPDRLTKQKPINFFSVPFEITQECGFTPFDVEIECGGQIGYTITIM